MKIIDAHMHFSNLSEYNERANEINQENSLNSILKEMHENNIVFGIGMGIGDLKMHQEYHPPMILDLDKDWKPIVESYAINIGCCPGIDPYMLKTYSDKYLQQLELYLNTPYILGIKIYLGYYLYYAYDPIYIPVYELASKYDVPIVYHTGDLAGTQGFLQYSKPLQVDSIATKYKNVNFVIAHFGNPWLLDAASVSLKNPNVYIDLSGLVVGAFKHGEILNNQKGYFDYLKSALDYLYNYDKLLYASDWPFVSLYEYISLIKEIIPTCYHYDVFYNNALKVFKRVATLLKE